MAHKTRFVLDGSNIGTLFDDAHVDFRVKFLDATGHPVDVEDPDFEVLSGGNPVDVWVLRPLDKISQDPEHVGEYYTTILTKGLTKGEYEVRFTGKVEGTPLTITGRFTLAEADTIQTMIETLRSRLGMELYEWPQSMLTIRPGQIYFSDGEMFDALQAAVDDLNMMPPILRNETWSLVGSDRAPNFPPVFALIYRGAMLHALAAKNVLEIANWYRINMEIQVDLFKGDKIQAWLSWLDKYYWDPLRRWKEYYVLWSCKPKAIVWTRVPRLVLRPLSMEPGYHSLGFNY